MAKIHVPVLLKEVIQCLNVKQGGLYIDATIGHAGHSEEIIKRGGIVLGIDRDSTICVGLKNKRLKMVKGNFSDIQDIAVSHGFGKVDGILFDLGIGSHQLDDPSRGFSFQNGGPLDMRYNQFPANLNLSKRIKQTDNFKNKPKYQIQDSEITAAYVINQYSETGLIEVFIKYGEEKRYAKKIASHIVERRRINSLKTTTELFNLIKATLPGKFRYKSSDVARRIFQALRIEVNKELQNLEKALPQAVTLLNKYGRLVVISFQSLEDRIVKKFLINEGKDCICPPEIPVCRCEKISTVKILTKHPIVAGSEEVMRNSRAASAKMRVAEKK